MSVPNYHPNYSPERRVHAIKVLRRSHLKPLTESAQILYAISLLICDDNGAFTQPAVLEAAKDQSVVAAARALLVKAGI